MVVERSRSFQVVERSRNHRLLHYTFKNNVSKVGDMMKLPVDEMKLPEEWVIQPLIEVAELNRGLSWRKVDETNESGTLVVSIPNIKDGYIDFESKYNHYLKIDIPESKKLKIGDILCVGSSGSLHNVGRNTKITCLPSDKIAFASFTFVCRHLDSKIHNDFLYYLLNSDLVSFEKFTKRAADGKFNFQLREFESTMRVPVPPLPEQRKIAYILSSVQKAIEQQDKLIKTSTELKKALMQKLFTEGLPMAEGLEAGGRKMKHTEIGPVPESWEVNEMQNIVDFKTGKLNSNAANENGIYPFFTCSQETFKINTFAFDQEAILLSGNNARAIYSVKHYKGKFNAYQRTYVITIINEEEYDYLFLKEALTRQLEYLKTISIGSQTRYLTLGMLTTLQIPKPNLEAQKFIGKTVQQFDKKIELIEAKKQTLTALFKTLLHELMTGQRKVHEIDFRGLSVAEAPDKAYKIEEQPLNIAAEK